MAPVIPALVAAMTPAGTGTLAVAQTAALATGTYAAAGGFSGKGGGFGGLPSIEAESARQTAGPVTQLSEQAKKTKRLKASMLTRDWGKPTLGTPGLLGM